MATDDYKFAYIMDDLEDVGWVRGMCPVVENIMVCADKVRGTRLDQLDLSKTFDKWDENADSLKEMHQAAVESVAHYATRTVKYKNIILKYKSKLEDAEKEIATYKKLVKSIVQENSSLTLDKADLQREVDRLQLMVKELPPTPTILALEEDEEDEEEEESGFQPLDVTEEVVVRNEDEHVEQGEGEGEMEEENPAARKKLSFDDVLMSS